jgi:transposase-like protein
MSRSKHTEAQMMAAVKHMEAGRKAEDVAREVGVSTHTIYAWKSQAGVAAPVRRDREPTQLLATAERAGDAAETCGYRAARR